MQDKNELLKDIFYSYSGQFNNFENISEEELETIKEYALELQKLTQRYLTRSDKYFRIMEILIKKQGAKDFDTNVLTLINAVDPSFVTLGYYLDSDLYKTKRKLKTVENEKEKIKLKKLEEVQNKQYIMDVRNEIGIYDKNLRKYEIAYYNKFLKNQLKQNKTK